MPFLVVIKITHQIFNERYVTHSVPPTRANKDTMPPTPPDESHALASLIQARYDDLPRSQKALARLVLADPSLVCTCTTLELAARAGVSNATVVRFASGLGFSGYAELQKLSRKMLLADRYIRETPHTGPMAHSLGAILERQKQQMKHAFSRISQDDFDRLTEAIASARRIYIAGVRAVYAPASFLARMLNLFFRNTTFLPMFGESAYEELFTGDENDLFICFSVIRYSQYSLTLTELAAQRNIPVVVITDNALSPAARLASITMEVSLERSTIISSVLGLTALVEALLSALSSRPEAGETIRKNLNQYEDALSPRVLIEDP